MHVTDTIHECKNNYHRYITYQVTFGQQGNNLNTEVKQRRAGLVLGWVTAWESPVLQALLFFFFNLICLLTFLNMHHLAGLVLRWETTWESPVLQAFLFLFFFQLDMFFDLSVFIIQYKRTKLSNYYTNINLYKLYTCAFKWI